SAATRVDPVNGQTQSVATLRSFPPHRTFRQPFLPRRSENPSPRLARQVFFYLNLSDHAELAAPVVRFNSVTRIIHLDSCRTSITRAVGWTVISKWSVCTISTILRGLCATTLMPVRRRRLL